MLTWVLGLVLVVIIYLYLKRKDKIWRDKGVPYVPTYPPFGNLNKTMFRVKSAPEVLQDLCNAHDSRYVGVQFFLQDTLLIKDLILLKQIGVKEFDRFSDHEQTINEDMDPLFGTGLFSLKGERWRNMRSTLSPAFTGSKMRMMFVLMSDCVEKFTDYFTEILKPDEPFTLELKDTFTRFANDIIATSAFGIECNSIKEKDNEFYLMGKDLTYFGLTRTLIFMGYNMHPSSMKWSGIHIFSDKLANFFRGVIKDTMRSREKQGIVRPDMIHLLMEARKGKLQHEKQTIDEEAGFATVEESDVGKQTVVKQQILSDDDITGQALLFFFAGFDTVSAALCHMVYELTIDQDIQVRLQREIDEAKQACKGKLNYETLVKMKYLDMVISESRFALLEVKVLVFHMLSKFDFVVVEKTEIPLKLSKSDFNMNAANGFWTRLKLRSE